MKGSITSRGENTWLIRFYPPGSKKQKAVTFHGTYEEAEIRLAELIKEAKTGFPTDPEKITVAELLDKFLAVKKGKVKETTRHAYSAKAKLWKKSRIADFPIQQLNPIDLEITLNELPGSMQTRLKAYTLLKEALKKAVQWKLLPYNPMDAVDPPRVEKKEPRVWTAKEAEQFLKTAEGHPYYVLFYLALKTGARLGELLALEWRNVDLDKKEIRITQTQAEISGKVRGTQSPKTRKSIRKIPLDDRTVEILMVYKHQREEEASRRGFGNISRLFWVDKSGGPVRSRYVEKAMRKLVQKAGVPDIPFHGLRHTHATLLLANNIHMKTIAERLGHETLYMTDLYSHVLPDTQQEAVRALDRLGF